MALSLRRTATPLVPSSFRLAVTLLLMVVIVRGAAAAPARNILPVSRVKAGQLAVGKSVFRGTMIESFHLKIIGVVPKFDGTRSVILAKVLDGPVVKRNSGIIQGMSGSPVYIDGKLIGAIALGWSYSKEPIAGITPIEDMIRAWSPQPASPPAAAEAATKLSRPIVVNGKPITRVRVESAPAARKDAPGSMTLVPLGGLVQVSGLNHRAVALLSDTFAKHGLQVVEGASGGGMEKLSPPLVPGAAIGAQLMRGDFQMAGLGTVTMVEGKRVLAFGHPFMQLGWIDLPMTGGYVYDIMPSLVISFKQMSPTRVIGRVSGDYQSAIAGEIGPTAKMMPVTIEVKDGTAPKHRYSVEVIRTRELMPALVASAAMTAVDEARTRTARGTAHVTLRFDFADRPSITRKEIAYSDSDPAGAVIPLLISPLTAFLESPYGELRPTRVSVQVQTEEGQRTASIERLTVGQSRFKPGDVVPLSVTVRPYGKAPVEIPVQFPLPADLAKGSVRLIVSSGTDADTARAGIGSPRPAPTSLDQMLERYATRESGFELVTQGSLTRGSAAMRGVEFPDLPRAAAEALQASRPSDLRGMLSVARVVTPTEWDLSGRATATIQVESPIAPSAPAGQAAGGTPSPQPSAGDEESDEEGADEEMLSLSPLPLAAEAPGNAPKPAEAAKPAKPSEKPEAAKPAEPAAEGEKGKEQKPLTSPPALWVERTRGDYAKAKLLGVAVADDGALSLVPGGAAADIPIPADVIWSIASRDKAAYVGTGTDGVIYRVSDTGEVSKFFDTGEMNVHALAFDSAGNLYAGTSPGGKLFRITPDGQGKAIYDSDSTYLWSLAIAPDGTVYAGGGSPARVYAISPNGTARTVAELNATNVVSLVLTKEGDLYAGTANTGLLYRVKPDGTASIAAQAAGSSVDALTMGGDGTLYFSSTPGGEIVRLRAGGLPEIYARTEQPVMYGLAAVPGDSLIAATGPAGLVFRITGENKAQLLQRPEAGTATALAVSGNDVYLASSAPTALRRMKLDAAGSGAIESTPLDAERTARWGTISAVAEVPAGTQVQIETRSGNSPDPKDRWSEWVAPLQGNIQSPPARYLQYRLTLTSPDPALTPVVREVRISRQPENRPPVVALKAPAAGSAVSKKVQAKWEGRDPDKDTLTYDLDLSTDVGRTWTTLKAGVADTKYDWDTTKTKDGQYLLRLTASDKRSEPWSPESATDSEVIVVDNTPPTLTLHGTTLTISDDRRATFTGLAGDALSPIVSVEYRVDDGDWQSVPFQARDAQSTDFTVTTDPLTPGDRKIEVRTFDAAGNAASDKLAAKVPDGAAKAEEKKPETTPAEPAKPTSEQKPVGGK